MNHQISSISKTMAAKFGLSLNTDIASKCKIWAKSSAALMVAATISTPALAVVAISDGFGDADLNNNGIALEDVDVSVQGGVGSTTYIPGRVFVDGMSSEPTNMEIDSVLDASDTGVRWLQMRGWSDGPTTLPNAGNSKPTLRIVDDSAGAMLETQAPGSGGLGITAIDDGNAMSWESRGGGASAAAFFDQNIALGSVVGDEVKVSFDFRMWRDAPNTNSGADSNNEADFGELRFGLYQDTDGQLANGDANPFAGRQVDSEGLPLPDPSTQFVPAVWGQEEGMFDGTLTGTQGTGDDVGSNGDAGWQASVIFGDSFLDNGGEVRIREELQSDRILQGGDVQTIAQPENIAMGGPFDPPEFNFVNLDMDGVYTIALSLKRATEVDPADTIEATLILTDKVTLETWSISGQDNLGGVGDLIGINSDSWDYFALRNASSGGGEYDFLLDNFTVEVNGSNEGDYLPTGLDGDFNDDGTVDAADYTVYRDNLGLSDAALNGNGTGGGTVVSADYTLWVNNYGATSSSSSASSVPEPSSFLLLLVAGTLISIKNRA